MKLRTVEVSYMNLCVDIKCKVVQGKPLPTLWNTLKSMFYFLSKTPGCNFKEARISILKDVRGVLKSARMTLLLGPPGCGKTTLLLALAGKLRESLKVMGDISYNGYKLNEFVLQKTSAYISQNDLHISEMTVRGILGFSARVRVLGIEEI